MKNFIEKYNVSCETMNDLVAYLDLLKEWQDKFNLVSKSSLEDAWNRHFADSAQLFKFIPNDAETLIDFGSGAGFPGMVLAIMGKNKTPYLKTTLVESIRKKTLYLNEVAQKTETSVSVINDRIENIKGCKFDVITSRAMTSLTDLLQYAISFCHKKTVCIFPKGRKFAEEISEAQKKWLFNCQIENSDVSDEGKILIITNISKKKEKTYAKNFSCR